VCRKEMVPVVTKDGCPHNMTRKGEAIILKRDCQQEEKRGSSSSSVDLLGGGMGGGRHRSVGRRSQIFAMPD